MRRGRVEKLSSTIEKILNDRGWGAKLKEYRVFSLWQKAVGPGIARHAQPASIRGKRLTVMVDSSAWMQQLSLLKPEILSRVNDRLGTDGVESITLKLGELERADERPEEFQPAAGKLEAGEQKRIEECIAGIKDPETREALKRVMEKDLLSKKRTARQQKE
jgi:predicted nucleic acid-binding Zn ribbon protein